MASTGEAGRHVVWFALLLALAGTLVASANASPVVNVDKLGVVLAPTPGSWDDVMVESPSVVRAGNRWAMAYTGYGGDPLRGQVGLAYSRDGIHWDRAGVILPAATGPVLQRDGDRWVLYYIGLTEAGYEQGHKTIRYATSRHLAGPWTRRGAVVAPDGTGWDAKAVWHASVAHRGGDWFLFFNATGDDGRERIGYATGPSLTGPWTVNPDPLLEPGSGQVIVGDPAVRREGARWVMTYYTADAEHAWDSEAVTTDSDFPEGWESTGPVLVPSEDYDSKYAHKPWTVDRGGRLFHYYTAVDADDRRQIALAVR